MRAWSNKSRRGREGTWRGWESKARQGAKENIRSQRQGPRHTRERSAWTESAEEAVEGGKATGSRRRHRKKGGARGELIKSPQQSLVYQLYCSTSLSIDCMVKGKRKGREEKEGRRGGGHEAKCRHIYIHICIYSPNRGTL